LEKPILAECAALHALSNRENLTALAFQMAELSIIECDIFRISHTPSTFGTGNGNEDGEIFFQSGIGYFSVQYYTKGVTLKMKCATLNLEMCNIFFFSPNQLPAFRFQTAKLTSQIIINFVI
jgi:hypothetical protein